MARSTSFLCPLALALAASALLSCGGGSPSAPVTPVVAAPSPTLPPAPVGFVCPLGKGTGPGTNCPHTSATLGDYVNAAIDKTIQEHPELFDFTAGAPGNPGVKDHDKYQKTVVDNINAMGGVCAKDDGEEIAVKNTNDFNEQWNIYYSLGLVRRSYITTCSPASF